MKVSVSKKAKAIALLLSAVYFASYIMKKNFSVLLAAITAAGYDAVALGAVGSALTLSYGTGQIISGIIGDKIKPIYMISFGLSLATVCNVALSFCTTTVAMTVVWFINGCAHSMLWPPMIRLMAAHMTDEEYSYSAVRIYIASSLATLVLYLISPVLLNFTEWNGVIRFTAVIGLAITLIWFVYGFRIFKSEPKKSVAEIPSDNENMKDEAKPSRLPRGVMTAVVLIIVAIAFHGALRDGVGDWMPTFMASTFDLDPKSAIITGIIPALFSILSTSSFDFIHRKLIKNEVACAGAIFGASALVCALLLITNLVGASGWLGAVASALLIAMVVVCMHGVNFMLITIVPKRFAKRGRVSSASGFINAATYLGSAIALPLFPALESSFSWSVTIGVWVAMSLVGTLLCFIAFPIWRGFIGDEKSEAKADE